MVDVGRHEPGYSGNCQRALTPDGPIILSMVSSSPTVHAFALCLCSPGAQSGEPVFSRCSACPARAPPHAPATPLTPSAHVHGPQEQGGAAGIPPAPPRPAHHHGYRGPGETFCSIPNHLHGVPRVAVWVPELPRLSPLVAHASSVHAATDRKAGGLPHMHTVPACLHVRTLACSGGTLTPSLYCWTR